MKKIYTIPNFVALVATVAVNYLSNSGMLNGNTMATVSAKYQNYFTPDGYAFSIWGLIYLGLFCFVGFSAFNKDSGANAASKIGWWFVVSCVANSLWVIAWLNEYLVVSVLIMLVLLASLIKIKLLTREIQASWQEKFFVKWTFSIYLGWVSVATIANVSALLTMVSWNGWGVSPLNWAVIMILVAGLLNIVVVLSRRFYAFGLVGIWALLAIAAANDQLELLYIKYACWAVASIIILAIGVKMLGYNRQRELIVN